jgi:hypothetical protein
MSKTMICIVSAPIRVLLGVALLLLAVQASALEASLDRNRVAEGEVVVLTVRADGGVDGTPDFAVLANDFDLVNQGQSSRMQFINGRSSSWREWHLTLAPRRLGTLQIPALRLGGQSTAPLALEVVPAAEIAQDGPPPPVLLEVEASPEQPVVQGKVIYTVRMLSRAPLRQVSLTEPRASGAIIERLGGERRGETYRKGQRYQAIERRYAIFPQRSGELDIDPPVLTAQVAEQAQRGGGNLRDRFFGGRDPFADLGGMFSQDRPIRLQARRVSLDVQPQPPGTPMPWLPAESLTLEESWSPDPPVFRVGEPVTRTLVITARGLSGSQLPDIPPAVAAGISVYPDKPQVSSRADGDTLVARRVMARAYVPSEAGVFTLPAIELAWWDAVDEQARMARLPAREVRVLAGATPPHKLAPSTGAPPAGAGQASPAPSSPPLSPRRPVTDSSALIKPAAQGSMGQDGVGPWPWLTGFFALAWLISMALWWRARRAPVLVDAPSATMLERKRTDASSDLRHLEAACRANDPAAARHALLDWAAQTLPDTASPGIEEIARRLPESAGECLAAIDRALYAPGQVTWDGVDAWRTLGPLLRQAGRRETSPPDSEVLPPLYPRDA